jgi:hypothetical protein
MTCDYLYTVSTMFDRLWEWIMGIITYLASLFGLNRSTVTEQKEQKEQMEDAPEPADPAPSE